MTFPKSLRFLSSGHVVAEQSCRRILIMMPCPFHFSTWPQNFPVGQHVLGNCCGIESLSYALYLTVLNSLRLLRPPPLRRGIVGRPLHRSGICHFPTRWRNYVPLCPTTTRRGCRTPPTSPTPASVRERGKKRRIWLQKIGGFWCRWPKQGIMLRNAATVLLCHDMTRRKKSVMILEISFPKPGGHVLSPEFDRVRGGPRSRWT